jgi:hypothetical protein
MWTIDVDFCSGLLLWSNVPVDVLYMTSINKIEELGFHKSTRVLLSEWI